MSESISLVRQNHKSSEETYDQLVMAFERVIPAGNNDAVRMIYVKQSSLTKGYAIKFIFESGHRALYTTNQWLPNVLTTVALLMAEHGIGCQWRPSQL